MLGHFDILGQVDPSVRVADHFVHQSVRQAQRSTHSSAQRLTGRTVMAR